MKWIKNSRGFLLNDDLPGISIQQMDKEVFHVNFPNKKFWLIRKDIKIINNRYFFLGLRDILESWKETEKRIAQHEEFLETVRGHIMNLN